MLRTVSGPDLGATQFLTLTTALYASTLAHATRLLAWHAIHHSWVPKLLHFLGGLSGYTSGDPKVLAAILPNPTAFPVHTLLGASIYKVN